MKKVLAILGVVLLAGILYVELTSFTNRDYWISRHQKEIWSYKTNAKLITPWNAFVSFGPNILHAINGIRLDIRRNLSSLKAESARNEWAPYLHQISRDSRYKNALDEVKTYLEELEKKVPLVEITDAQALGEGVYLSEEAKEILRNYNKLYKARRQEYQNIIESGSYATERSTLLDGLKIHPEYGGDEDLLVAKLSKFFAQCVVYLVIIILLIFLIPIAFGVGEKKNFLKKTKDSKAYQLFKDCIHWSLWRIVVSSVIAVTIALFCWAGLFGGSSYSSPHDRLLLPFVGLLWGSIAGLLSYTILLIFSAKTYHAIRVFLQWKHWKIAASAICMLVMCLFMTLGILDADTPKPSERLLPPVFVFVVSLIFGLISFGGLWLISFIVKKVVVWKKKESKHKEKDEPSEKKELEREKEKLQNQILSLEVAELKKRLADLESKQEKRINS